MQFSACHCEKLVDIFLSAACQLSSICFYFIFPSCSSAGGALCFCSFHRCFHYFIFYFLFFSLTFNLICRVLYLHCIPPACLLFTFDFIFVMPCCNDSFILLRSAPTHTNSRKNQQQQQNNDGYCYDFYSLPHKRLLSKLVFLSWTWNLLIVCATFSSVFFNHFFFFR